MACRKVKFKSVQADDAAAEVRSAVHTSLKGSDLAKTIEQEDRKTELPKLDPGEVASTFMVHHVKKGGVPTATKPITPPLEAEPSTEQLSSLPALVTSSAIPYVNFAARTLHSYRSREKNVHSGNHLVVTHIWLSKRFRPALQCGRNHVTSSLL